MILMKDFKAKVERLQAVKGLTATEISRRAGKNDTWLSTLYRAETVRPRTVHLVAKAMKVKPDYFFCRSS